MKALSLLVAIMFLFGIGFETSAIAFTIADVVIEVTPESAPAFEVSILTTIPLPGPAADAINLSPGVELP